MSLQTIGTFPTFFRPRATAAAGTRIRSIIPPRGKKRSKLTTVKYTAGTTAHTLTVLRPLGTAAVVNAIAAGATAAVLTRDPGNYSANHPVDGLPPPLAANNLLVANDLLLIQTANPDVYHLAVATAITTGVDGRVSLTITAAPAGGIPAGARVFFMGLPAYADPRTGEAHPTYLAVASVQTAVDGNGGSVGETVGREEPMLLDSDNATVAGSFDTITGVYSDN